jgi:DNA-binding response OmpR family regulator
LGENGYVVDAEMSAELGLRMAVRGFYDLVVLDINLPDRSGWWVLKELREANCHTPVLCLTCRGEVEDRVRGLELGADDYLVKPFAFSELLARVRAVLRRGVPNENPIPVSTPAVVNFSIWLFSKPPIHKFAPSKAMPTGSFSVVAGTVNEKSTTPVLGTMRLIV